MSNTISKRSQAFDQKKITAQTPALRQFRKSMNRFCVIWGLIGLLLADLLLYVGAFYLEISATEWNVGLTILDFLITFRIFPVICLFLMYGITAYAITKLGVVNAKFQVTVLCLYSVGAMFVQTAESTLQTMYSYGLKLDIGNFWTVFWGFLFSSIPGLLLSIVGALLVPAIIIWICSLLSRDYRQQIAQNGDDAARRSPVPTVCLGVVLAHTLIQLVTTLYNSIETFEANGRFFANGYEVFTFVEPYLELIVFGIAGYWLMRLIAHRFTKKIDRMRAAQSDEAPAVSSEEGPEESSETVKN